VVLVIFGYFDGLHSFHWAEKLESMRLFIELLFLLAGFGILVIIEVGIQQEP
jgi:hypothetical protein